MKRILLTVLALCILSASKPAPLYDVILDTDTNNELDDQHALAYLLMNPETFRTVGVTTNNTHNGDGIAGQTLEARRVISLVGKFGKGIVLKPGAEADFETIRPTIGDPSFDGHEAVDFIIEKARGYSPANPLVVIAVGKLTNIALVALKAPEVLPNIRLVWLGSNYPLPGEYNLKDDIPSMNYLLDTDVRMEIVTVRARNSNGTGSVTVSRDFVIQNFAGKGPRITRMKNLVEGRHGGLFACFGDYSVSLFNHIKLRQGGRALYDLCAVAIVKNPGWAKTVEIPAPTMIDGKWVERPENPRKILIWEDFDRDGIVGDFTATLDRTTPKK